MTHAASVPQSANAFWKLPERIELDDGQRAEQFAAFLKARVSERSRAPEVAPARANGLPALPARSRSTNDRPGASAPPPHAQAHAASRGNLPMQRPLDQAPPAGLTEGPEAAGPADGPPEPAATVQPFTPRYQDVPDAWKWPIGPYQQAPPEFGGEWWKVNPFTGSEPWRPVEITNPTEPEIPEGFTEIFGTRPQASAFSGFRAFKAADLRWQQDLKYFQRSGIPEGFDQAQVDLASGVFENWDMGQPVFYEGRYGWMARFPDSAIPDFEANVTASLEVSHIIVAKYQTRQLLHGVTPAVVHPFVPPFLAPVEA